MPEVSVVIPAYNPGKLLHRALESVLAQTMDTFEVVVVDDGSKEDLSWVDGVDGRVRLVRQRNCGVSSTRNRGVLLSSAAWVAFCDQDDEWHADKLERQLAAVRIEPDSTFCSTGFIWVQVDGSEAYDGRPMTFPALASDGHVCLSSAMVSRERYFEVGGQNPLLHQQGDFDLFLKLARRGPVAHVEQPLVRYHYHLANASADYRSAYRERQAVLRLHEIECQRVGDATGATACRTGRKRSRTLYGAQAYDAARKAYNGADLRGVPMHLSRAALWSPAYVGRSLAKVRSAPMFLKGSGNSPSSRSQRS